MTITLSDEAYAEVADQPVAEIVGRVRTVEVTQEGGLLSEARRVIGVQALSGVVAKQQGLPDEPGVPIRVCVADQEEVEDGSRGTAA